MKAALIAPPYTGSQPTCRMCGNVGASTVWQALEGLGTCLRRACNRCNYGWIERPTASTGHATGQYV